MTRGPCLRLVDGDRCGGDPFTDDLPSVGIDCEAGAAVVRVLLGG